MNLEKKGGGSKTCIKERTRVVQHMIKQTQDSFLRLQLYGTSRQRYDCKSVICNNFWEGVMLR